MQYRTEFSDSLPGYVTIMTFQLRTETISSQHLQGMKNALFNKLAKSLPAAFFTPQKSISVSKLIEKIIPYLQGFQGPPPPDWWSQLQEPPKQFGLRMHSLLKEAFLLLRQQAELLTANCAGKSSNEIESVLLPFLFKELITPALIKSQNSHDKNGVLMAGLGLKEWIRHLSDILSTYPKGEPFNTPLFFIAAELPAHALIHLPVQGQQRDFILNGQMDAIIYDYHRERFYLYEYKTGGQTNYLAPILQCVLYHELIRLHCGEKLQADAVLAFFSPEKIDETALMPEETGSTPKIVVVPPQTKEHIAAPSGEPVQKEAEKLLTEAVHALKAYGLKISPKGTLIGPRFIQLRIFPEENTTVNQIKNRNEDLRVKMNLAVTPRIVTGQGFVAIEVERRKPEIIYLADPRFSSPPGDPKKRCQFPLGIDVNGDAHWLDLADSNSAHLLIGGTTGSGKSAFLLSAIQYLQNNYTAEQLRFVIIDPKQVTYTKFNQSPFLLKPIIKSRQLSIEALEMLVSEMDARYANFGKHKVDSYVEWNNYYPDKPIPRWIIIFDEYADYMMDKSFRDAIESSIERLGFMARAAGIHLIIALQRPDAKTVSGRIKSNLPGRIAFRVASQIESKIILDESGAEDLLGKGDLLVKTGPHLNRVQAPL